MVTDHFAVFGLPRRQALDVEQLEALYRARQAEVHPDRFAHASDAERRRAMEEAARVNEAYVTLKDPLKRARHLLELAGHDVGLETNTAMPADFLMAQLERREAVAAARAQGDSDALDAAARALRKEIRAELAALETALEGGDHAAAGERVRRLMFHEKLLHEIDEAFAALET